MTQIRKLIVISIMVIIILPFSVVVPSHVSAATIEDETETVKQLEEAVEGVEETAREALGASMASVSYAAYNGVDYTNSGISNNRILALNKAKEMVTIQWTAIADFRTWCSKSGSYNTVTATDGSSDTYFRKGKTYTGIPYSMSDHTYDNIKWKNYVESGYITTSNMSGTYYDHGYTTTAHGIDCSYFVYKAIEASVGSSNVSYQTTATMVSDTTYYTKLSSFSEMLPADLFLKNGHVMMFVGKSGNNYAVFEATATGSKCRYHVYSASDLISYSAYRYKGFSDPVNVNIKSTGCSGRDAGGFMIYCEVENVSAVQGVTLYTWDNASSPIVVEGMAWPESGSNKFKLYVNYNKFSSSASVYYNHVYVTSKSGEEIRSQIIGVAKTGSNVEYEYVKVVGEDSGGYMVECKVNDRYLVKGITLATWTDVDGTGKATWEPMLFMEEYNAFRYYVPYNSFSANSRSYYNDVYIYTYLDGEEVKSTTMEQRMSLLDPVVYNDAWYAEHNESVSGMTAEERKKHWLDYGSHMGWQASPAFFAVEYCRDNPDVAAAFGTTDYAFSIKHFVENGIEEFRQGRGMFNPQYYKGNYADLQSAFGNNNYSYYYHYVTQGYFENRIGYKRLQVYFDTSGGGSSSQAQRDLTVGAAIGTLPTLTREGYTGAWYTKQNGGTRVTESYVYNGGEDLTLYAVWDKTVPDLVLPTSTRAVEAEAFMGGAFEYVRLSAYTKEIGSKAFAYCPNLKYIYIPEGTTTIAADAFEGVSGLTVYGKAGSYAQTYAQSHGFRFSAQ